jgi:1-acyl-sn-glycerol-3-phosphate acyltransferase
MNLSYASLKLAAKIYQTLLPQNCRVFGADHLPPGAKIIAANHPNCTDTFFLPFVIKEQLHILIKGVHFNNPVIGWLLTNCGHIPVNSGQGRAAFDKACEYLAKGEALLIYPEAQWNPENRRLKGKSGAVRMSLATGAPIIPLGIYVSDDNTRTVRVNRHGRTRQARWQIKGSCYLCFGDPWLPSEETHGEADPGLIHKLTDRLMGKIYDLSRLAFLKSRLEQPVERIPAGIDMVGIQAAGLAAGDSISANNA